MKSEEHRTVIGKLAQGALDSKTLPETIDIWDLEKEYGELRNRSLNCQPEKMAEWGSCIVKRGNKLNFLHKVIGWADGVDPACPVDHPEHCGAYVGFAHTHLPADLGPYPGFSAMDFGASISDGDNLSLVCNGKMVFGLVRTADCTQKRRAVPSKEIEAWEWLFAKQFELIFRKKTFRSTTWDRAMLSIALLDVNILLCQKLGFALYEGYWAQPLCLVFRPVKGENMPDKTEPGSKHSKKDIEMNSNNGPRVRDDSKFRSLVSKAQRWMKDHGANEDPIEWKEIVRLKKENSQWKTGASSGSSDRKSVVKKLAGRIRLVTNHMGQLIEDHLSPLSFELEPAPVVSPALGDEGRPEPQRKKWILDDREFGCRIELIISWNKTDEVVIACEMHWDSDVSSRAVPARLRYEFYDLEKSRTMGTGPLSDLDEIKKYPLKAGSWLLRIRSAEDENPKTWEVPLSIEAGGENDVWTFHE